MDIVAFFKDLVDHYNNLEKCGFCWSFGAPLSESALNKQQLRDEEVCCMNIFLSDVKYRSEIRYNTNTGLQNYEACNITFTLYVGRQTEDLGLNSYNEINDHPITESLWETIWKPLQDCFGCGRELDLCELGWDFDITKWDMSMVKFKEDINLTGWRIDGAFRIPNQNI